MPTRLFGIRATQAPIIAVIRSGPRDWWQVGRWDLEAGTYEGGDWFRGTLYPQRSDLSPDGRWLVYMRMKGHGPWTSGFTRVAVSRVPWTHALAAWHTEDTWSRGAHFAAEPGPVDPPDEGTLGPLGSRLGLAKNRPLQFANELRRGWVDAPDSPPRPVGGDDEMRVAIVERPSPVDPALRLRVHGKYFGHRTHPELWSPRKSGYALVVGEQPRPLEDVHWADWADDGQLVVMTRAGALQLRAAAGEVTWSLDLSSAAPERRDIPLSAMEW